MLIRGTKVYAGGPLAQQVGDLLVQNGVTLSCLYGGTEFLNPTQPPVLSSPTADWNWISFGGEMVKVEWADQGDGTYELVVHVST